MVLNLFKGDNHSVEVSGFNHGEKSFWAVQGLIEECNHSGKVSGFYQRGQFQGEGGSGFSKGG